MHPALGLLMRWPADSVLFQLSPRFHRRFSLYIQIQYMPHVAGQLSRRFTQCRPHDQRTSSANCVRRPFELAAPALSCFLIKISSVNSRRICGPRNAPTTVCFWTPFGRSCFPICSRARTNVFRTKTFPAWRIPFRPRGLAVNAWSLTVLTRSHPFWARPVTVLYAYCMRRNSDDLHAPKPKRGSFLPAREHLSSGAPFSAAPEKGGGCRFQEPLDCRAGLRVQLLSPCSCKSHRSHYTCPSCTPLCTDDGRPRRVKNDRHVSRIL
jgi:hypothetical protein